MDRLPHFYANSHDIFRMISPLICFHIGEWHHLERTLKQSGLKQDVPLDYNTEPLVHNVDLRIADWSDRVAH